MNRSKQVLGLGKVSEDSIHLEKPSGEPSLVAPKEVLRQVVLQALKTYSRSSNHSFQWARSSKLEALRKPLDALREKMFM
jgi:hypothetical protein